MCFNNHMVIVKIQGGLGNQMFQYAAGRKIAFEKETSLKLDTSYFNTQDLRTYELDIFNIEAGIATPAELKPYTGRFSRFLRLISFTSSNKYIHESSFAFNPE